MTTEYGIHTIDTGFNRPKFDASYLIVEGDRAAFVDTGTNHSVPRLLEALHAAGCTEASVDWVILTHVHLDHAGGAGELMARLPNARLAVHPRGARHMIDPSRLWAGASAVYGEDEMKRSYGALRPVPAERVVQAGEGTRLDLAGRELLCLDTPGHARHHICIWDAKSRGFFTGDTFGLSYRELDSPRGAFVIPTTTPVQFDPDALHASVDRMLEMQPRWMYLTHFGRIGDVASVAADLHGRIDATVEAALTHADDTERHAAIVDALTGLYADEAAAHGCRLGREEVIALLASDIELNAQGLEVWLDQRSA